MHRKSRVSSAIKYDCFKLNHSGNCIIRIVLHCIVLYCIVLYCIVLYCIVLYWIVLDWIGLDLI